MPRGMTDGEREIWNEMQRDAIPTLDECVAEFVGKRVDDLIDEDYEAWQEEMERINTEAYAANVEAWEQARWEAEDRTHEQWKDEQEAQRRAYVGFPGDEDDLPF